jgi:heme/copper-type cytochrome/quinol oxidase subunit 2
MSIPSFVLLYSLEESSEPVFNIAVIGNQWYRTYEYIDFDVQKFFALAIKHSAQSSILELKERIVDSLELGADEAAELVVYAQFPYELDEIVNMVDSTISIDCQILPDSDLPRGYPRLLCTDQVLVIPSDTTIRFLVTSNDVIHSRALPSFGIKIDAVPGRINQVVTRTPFFGSSWGQCSELRGVNHGFMPIEIRAIAVGDFSFYIKLLIRSLIETKYKSVLDQMELHFFWASSR